MKISDTDTYPLNVIMDAMKDVPGFDAERIYSQGINDALDKLSAREVFILRKRYAEGKTLKAIGKDLCVSGERIAQLLNRSLRRLREPAFSGLFIMVPKASLNEAIKALHGMQKQYDQLQQDYEALKNQHQNLMCLLTLSSEAHIPLKSLSLPPRTYDALLDAGVCTVDDLVRLSAADLEEIKCIPKTAIRSIRKALQTHGLFLRGDCKE